MTHSAPHAAVPPTGLTHNRWVMMAVLVVLFGSAFLLIKVGVGTLPPLTMVMIRLIVAAAALTAALYALGRSLPTLWTRQGLSPLWRVFAVLAVTGNILPFSLITWGSQSVPSAVAGILMAVMPLTTLGLAALFVPGETITMRRLGGFLAGFAGIVVLFAPDILTLGGAGTVLAQLAMVAAAFSYAGNAILTKRMPPCTPLAAGAGIHLCAALFMMPFAFLLEDPLAITPSMTSLTATVLLGLLSSAAGTLVLLRLIAQAGPTFTSQINYLVPLWAVGMGYVFLGEVPGWNALGALALILAGIALAQMGTIPPVKRCPPVKR